MSKRIPFNWSLLTQDMLYSMLNRIQGKVVGKKLPVDKLTSILSKHIKQHLPVKVISERNPKTLKDYVYVGGAYHSTSDKKGFTRYIEILFSYNSEQQSVKLSRYKWLRICELFADTVLHEIIHTRQYRARNFKNIPGYESTAYYAKDRKEQEYYGDTDEMGAHSFNIACELYKRFGDNFGDAKRYLDSNNYRRHKRSGWHRYMKTFDYDHHHKIIKIMKRKILNQLPYAQYGKPFKTSNYLTY